MTDPATAEWREAMGASTSARLRSAELEVEGVREELTRQASANQDLQLTLAIRTKALAASQADLTRVYGERDEARAEAKEWRAQAHLYDLARARFRLSNPEATDG